MKATRYEGIDKALIRICAVLIFTAISYGLIMYMPCEKLDSVIYRDNLFHGVWLAWLILAICSLVRRSRVCKRKEYEKAEPCKHLAFIFCGSAALTALFAGYRLWLWPDRAENRITILTSRSKADWLNEVIDEFNHRYLGRYKISLLPNKESRAGMLCVRQAAGWPIDDLDKETTPAPTPQTTVQMLMPTIFAPSRSLWLMGLIQNHYGEYAWQSGPLVHLKAPEKTGGSSGKRYTLDPNFVHFAISTPMWIIASADSQQQAQVKEVFQQPTPWTYLSSCKNLPVHFFSIADPFWANSGAEVVFLMLSEFQARNSTKYKSLYEAANSGEFRNYMAPIQGAHYRFNIDDSKPDPDDRNPSSGTASLMRAYTSQSNDGKPISLCLLSYKNMITNYVSANSHPVATPNTPTLITMPLVNAGLNDHPFVILNAPWVKAKQIEGARTLFDFIDQIATHPNLTVLRNRLGRFNFDANTSSTVSLNEDDYYGQNVALTYWRKP